MAIPRITLVQTAAGTHHRVRREIARDPGTGKRRWQSETVATEAEAEMVKARWLLDREVVGGRLLLAAYLDDHWLPDYRERRTASSWTARRCIVKKWIIPTWGKTRLEDLTPRVIERGLVTMRTNGASPGRVKVALDTLAAALRVAVNWGMLHENPCSRVRPPTMPATDHPDMWTAGQARTFLASVDDALWLTLWLTLAGTGMRIGEARALQWHDVNWDVPSLRIRRTWARAEDGPYLATPKSQAGNREVTIPESLAAQLTVWRAEQARCAWQIGLPVQPESFVFTHAELKPLSYSVVQKTWDRHIASASVPRVKMHSLRHLAATEQLMAGIPLKIVSARIGHSTIGITANIYSHVLIEHQHEAARVLESLITSQGDANVTALPLNTTKSAEA